MNTVWPKYRATFQVKCRKKRIKWTYIVETIFVRGKWVEIRIEEEEEKKKKKKGIIVGCARFCSFGFVCEIL